MPTLTKRRAFLQSQGGVVDSEERKHAAMIRGIGLCAAAFHNDEPCNGPIQSCHVRKGSNAGMGTKPRKRELPMCAHHHHIQHQLGEVAFWGDKLNYAITLACVLGTMADEPEMAKEEVLGFRYSKGEEND